MNPASSLPVVGASVAPANDGAPHDPPVFVFAGPNGFGWPNAEGKPPLRGTVGPASTLLTFAFPYDAHFTQYVPERWPTAAGGQPCRLNLAQFRDEHFAEVGRVHVVVIAFDVDDPVAHENETPARTEWINAELPKIVALRQRHPELFVFFTRGGYRIVGKLPPGIFFQAPADVSRWKDLYAACIRYLDYFQIKADDNTKDAPRVFRTRFVVRDEKQTRDPYAAQGDQTLSQSWEFPREVFDLIETTPAHPAPVRMCEPAPADVVERAKAYLAKMPPAVAGQNGHTALWNATLHAGHGFALSESQQFDLLWNEYNPRCSPPWSESEIRHKISDAAKSHLPRGFKLGPARALPLADAGLSVFCKCDDIGNGERLLQRFGHGLRYVDARRKWIVWSASEGRWTWDDGPTIDRLAQYTARQIHQEAADAEKNASDSDDHLGAWAVKSADVHRRQAMIKSASSHCAIDAGALDRDPNLLNCANGTLNLQTGELHAHSPADLITKSTGLPYVPGARHELWDRVLHRATGGDMDMSAFLQRLAGYCATGYTTEKHFFFIYSEKHDTAKSTFCDALQGALGDYAKAADFGTWLDQPNGGNRGDVVRLMGARLVISVEVEEQAKFNAKLLKAWTGGDEITAAAKYEADVSFRPQGKIVLAANSAPKIRHADRPLFERCIRIPFDVQIPKAEQDKSVKLRLLYDPDVRVAVLAWMVEGCRMWAEHGLAPPPAVAECSRAYRVESDWLASFLTERCSNEPDKGQEHAETARAVFRMAIQSWFTERGLRPPSTTNAELAKRLEEYGVKLVAVNGERRWRGVRVLPAD